MPRRGPTSLFLSPLCTVVPSADPSSASLCILSSVPAFTIPSHTSILHIHVMPSSSTHNGLALYLLQCCRRFQGRFSIHAALLSTLIRIEPQLAAYDTSVLFSSTTQIGVEGGDMGPSYELLAPLGFGTTSLVMSAKRVTIGPSTLQTHVTTYAVKFVLFDDARNRMDSVGVRKRCLAEVQCLEHCSFFSIVKLYHVLHPTSATTTEPTSPADTTDLPGGAVASGPVAEVGGATLRKRLPFSRKQPALPLAVAAVMEHADLKDLRAEVKRRRAALEPFFPEEVASMMLQILLTLEYLHGHGIIHRDVKTANILLCGNGIIKLADFGFCKVVGESPEYEAAAAEDVDGSDRSDDESSIAGADTARGSAASRRESFTAHTLSPSLSSAASVLHTCATEVAESPLPNTDSSVEHHSPTVSGRSEMTLDCRELSRASSRSSSWISASRRRRKLRRRSGKFLTSNHFQYAAESQVFCGTPFYMAPEVWLQRPYGSKCDMFSLGCVLFEMITLERAFHHDDVAEVRAIITNGMQPSTPSFATWLSDTSSTAELHHRRVGLYQHLLSIALELMQFDPTKRPDTRTLLARPVMREACSTLLEVALNPCASGLTAEEKSMILKGIERQSPMLNPPHHSSAAMPVSTAYTIPDDLEQILARSDVVDDCVVAKLEQSTTLEANVVQVKHRRIRLLRYTAEWTHDVTYDGDLDNRSTGFFSPPRSPQVAHFSVDSHRVELCEAALIPATTAACGHREASVVSWVAHSAESPSEADGLTMEPSGTRTGAAGSGLSQQPRIIIHVLVMTREGSNVSKLRRSSKPSPATHMSLPMFDVADVFLAPVPSSFPSSSHPNYTSRDVLCITRKSDGKRMTLLFQSDDVCQRWVAELSKAVRSDAD